MGDHRFSFKAEFEMHGVEDQINLAWHNWDGGRDGIDSRITDWLCGIADRAFAKYDSEMDEYFRRQKAPGIELEERAELARLKAKYGD